MVASRPAPMVTESAFAADGIRIIAVKPMHAKVLAQAMVYSSQRIPVLNELGVSPSLYGDRSPWRPVTDDRMSFHAT
jgi:hypothetical protein